MDWGELERKCRACQECILCRTRKNVVFGGGNPGAKALIVGEAPGAEEDESGLPFVGRAGRLLDEMLAGVGLSREDVYIANVVKCRPPGNRDPLGLERNACHPWLAEQIRLMNPSLVVCLGRVPAKHLIKSDFAITQEHGQWFVRDGVRYMAIYHPAYLLRDPRKRPEAYGDMKILAQAIRQTE